MEGALDLSWWQSSGAMLREIERRLCRLFAAATLGRFDEVTKITVEAPAGEPNREWREALLMIHLFAGFPRAIETFERVRRASGLGSFEEDECVSSHEQNFLESRGAELFDRIYGSKASNVRSQLGDYHPVFANSISQHAYGRVLSRPGMSARFRELLVVSSLCVQHQWPQLAGHIRGGIRCGASLDEVFEVVDVISDMLTDGELSRVQTLVRRFAS